MHQIFQKLFYFAPKIPNQSFIHVKYIVGGDSSSVANKTGLVAFKDTKTKRNRTPTCACDPNDKMDTLGYPTLSILSVYFKGIH